MSIIEDYGSTLLLLTILFAFFMAWGVGLAKGIGALNLRMVGTIFISWLITLPAGAILAIIFFCIFKAVFGSV